MPAGQFLIGLVLPGFAFRRAGRRWSLLAAGAYGLAAAICVVWLGHNVATLAFGLMISLHAWSILYLLSQMVEGRLRVRIGLAFLTLLGVTQLIYLPIQNWTQQHWVMPLRVRGQVVIIQTFPPAPAVQRGEWVAYRIERHGGHGAYVREGLGLDQVLAVAGDRVRFTAEHFKVNGKAYPRASHMPTEGEWQVPADHWFIWPQLDQQGHGEQAELAVAALLREQALVSFARYVGKPCQRWFWRRQKLS
jgi:hypothetical protein